MTLAARIEALSWPAIEAELDARGCARAGPLLEAAECEALVALYGEDRRFRKRVEMARHRFGVGDYAYFDEPLPKLVATLRNGLYRRLAPTANRWNRAVGERERFPARLPEFIERCHRAGQMRPTPLLLRYETDGFNCLHRDLYGDVAFPLQAMVLLSRPGRDFRGGEFLVVENRARQQSRGVALAPSYGELILFANSWRPVQGARGMLRASLRHGVSPVDAGRRFALGVIFHDAA